MAMLPYPYEANEGVFAVDEFLGDWFIRKTMWSTVHQIKANAASLKKFYTFMFEKGEIEQEDLDELRYIIGVPCANPRNF